MLKWFKCYNACYTYFFPLKKIVQQFLEVTPEVLRSSASTEALSHQPQQAHFTHTSQNGAFCLSIQLEDDCDVLPTLFDTRTPSGC